MDSIKEILGDIFKKLSSERVYLSIRIQKVWETIVDRSEALHTRIEEFRNGMLMVNVDSSARLFQINLKKKEILGKLQKEIPEVKTILFKMGKVL